MARKPTKRTEFVLFDVIYEDGSQRSNRRVPGEALDGLEGEAAARTSSSSRTARSPRNPARSRFRSKPSSGPA